MAASKGSETSGDGVGQCGYDWTQAYERWQDWEDPDEAAKRREEEATRLRNMRENNMTCAHDRLEERKVMDMPIHDKLEACREFRRKGNLFHEEGQYRRAALQYRQALVYYDFCFPEETEIQEELDEIRQACLLNSAACFLRCRELEQTMDCCYQVLQVEPENVKALYRRAVVYRVRDQFREAAVDLGKALALRPNDVLLRKENAVLKSKMASYRERSKTMGQQIFGSRPPANDTSWEEADLGFEDEKASPCFIEADMEFDLDDAGEGVGARYDVASIGRGRLGVENGNDEEEGRRRHDLSLPVCIDLSILEQMTDCAWSVD